MAKKKRRKHRPRKKNNIDIRSFFEKIKLLFSAYFSVVYCFSSIWAVISNTMEWRALTYHEKTPYTTSVKER